MSSKKPSETNRIRELEIAGSFEGELSSPLHLSQAPTPQSVGVGTSSDNPTSISPLNMVPVVGVDDAPATLSATEATTEAYNMSLAPPISVPDTVVITVPNQLGFARGGGIEPPLTHLHPASHSPLSLPSLPNATMQVSRESEENLSKITLKEEQPVKSM